MKIKTFFTHCFILAIGVFIAPNPSRAGETILGLGLWQPLVFQGFNAEIDYLTENWVFEYSHGMNLNISAFKPALTKEEQDQEIKLKAPYSTGFGIGYRLTKEFNVRLEFKEHQFEITHPSGEKIKYINQDIGFGAYYFWRPFNNSLLVIPSLRYWPTYKSSLEDKEYTFSNGDVHKAHSFNVFGNVTVGWQF